MNLKKIRNLFMSKFVGTGRSSYEKRIYGPRYDKVWETLLYI